MQTQNFSVDCKLGTLSLAFSQLLDCFEFRWAVGFCGVLVVARGPLSFSGLRRVAMGDSSEKDEQLQAFKALFSAPSNDTKLPAVLCSLLATYHIDELKLADVDEVPRNEPDEMEEAASEAWSLKYAEKLPKPHALRVRTWAGEVALKKGAGKEPLAGQRSSIGDIAEDDRRIAAKEEAKDMDISPFEREKAVKDMAAQGLTCARIVALSQSLILGKVCKPSMIGSLKYGEDPALSDLSKAMRKARKTMLADIIKNKNYAEAGGFFSDVMASYASDGMSTESSLVASWWAETSGCFSSDKELLFEYLQAYFDKYAGRGLPERVDTVLVTRIRNQSASAGGASKEELKQMKSKLEEQAGKIEKLSSKVNTLEQKVSTFKPKVTPEEQVERRSKVTCHKCGKKGHYASECPEAKEDGG